MGRGIWELFSFCTKLWFNWIFHRSLVRNTDFRKSYFVFRSYNQKNYICIALETCNKRHYIVGLYACSGSSSSLWWLPNPISTLPIPLFLTNLLKCRKTTTSKQYSWGHITSNVTCFWFSSNKTQTSEWWFNSPKLIRPTTVYQLFSNNFEISTEGILAPSWIYSSAMLIWGITLKRWLEWPPIYVEFVTHTSKTH